MNARDLSPPTAIPAETSLSPSANRAPSIPFVVNAAEAHSPAALGVRRSRSASRREARLTARLYSRSLRLELEAHTDGRSDPDLAQGNGFAKELAASTRALNGHLIHPHAAVPTTRPRIVV